MFIINLKKGNKYHTWVKARIGRHMVSLATRINPIATSSRNKFRFSDRLICEVKI